MAIHRVSLWHEASWEGEACDEKMLARLRAQHDLLLELAELDAADILDALAPPGEAIQDEGEDEEGPS